MYQEIVGRRFSVKLISLLVLLASPPLAAHQFCYDFFIEPNLEADRYDDDQILGVAGDRFTLFTYQMPEGSGLPRIIVMGPQPKLFGLLGPNAEAAADAEEVLDELLVRNPLVLAAYGSKRQKALLVARTLHAYGHAPATERDRTHFSYLDRGLMQKKPLIAQAMTRQVRKFRGVNQAIQIIYSIPSTEDGPIFLKDPLVDGRQNHQVKQIVDMIQDLQGVYMDPEQKVGLKDPATLLVLSDDHRLPKVIVEALNRRVQLASPGIYKGDN